MRVGCWECVMKHISTAVVYVQEANLGYPKYKYYAIGEMVHAEYELIQIDPDLANILRHYRREYFNLGFYPIDQVMTLLIGEFEYYEQESSDPSGRE